MIVVDLWLHCLPSFGTWEALSDTIFRMPFKDRSEGPPNGIFWPLGASGGLGLDPRGDFVSTSPPPPSPPPPSPGGDPKIQILSFSTHVDDLGTIFAAF